MVLQQVFPLIQTLLSRWLDDSEVVEVGTVGVRPIKTCVAPSVNAPLAVLPGSVLRVRQVGPNSPPRLCTNVASVEWDAGSDLRRLSAARRS